MARKPLRPCRVAGCKNLTEGKYCKEHEHKEAENLRNYDRFIRDKKTTKFYKSKAWKTLRLQALIRDRGLCQLCLKEKKITKATIVDHIIPVKVRWDLRLKLNNLQFLCQSCHNRKTAEDERKFAGLRG